ncbi:Putative diguanylate cyclase GGDEF domain protein [Salinisphaera shabanensis E1L3A]|uniref:diguanylate cyclase n=1 Tax=Salinisphaera shabanensis E1L3A TaxID=1033802 RepID=F7Q640_9GAMM|nr:Putative diguanylate cyclase GGDEF domain protein [Salinisphaera shabanensis E1L3A]
MLPENEPGRYRISRWRVEFSDGDTERRYRRHIEGPVANYVSRMLVVWGVLWLLFGLSDYYQFGFSLTLYGVWAARLILFCGLLASAALVRQRPWLATSGLVMTPAALVGMTSLFALYFISAEDNIRWLAAVNMVLILELFVLFPNRTVYSLGIALYTAVGTWVSVQLNIGETTPIRMILLAAFLLIPAVSGWFAAQRFETTRRREFMALELARAEIERRAALEAKLLEQAQTDPLTGAFNRRAYAGAAQREMCRARVSGQPLSFVMLDLDHFKRVNDTFGHATGDAALVSTANLCREVLRESDIFGRLGGEEFILIMPGTDQYQARAIAETIRTRLAGSDLVSGSHCVRLTATLAVTQFDASDEDLDDVLRRADAALYEGKNAGRDRVEAA